MRCRLFHAWGGWGREYSFGFERYQRKTCTRCGKETTRKIGWDTN